MKIDETVFRRAQDRIRKQETVTRRKPKPGRRYLQDIFGVVKNGYTRRFCLMS